MNISYNWLKEYVNFDLTPDETAAALTSIGLETGGVEEVQTIKGGLEGLVIGEVLTCTEHPNSDHLRQGSESGKLYMLGWKCKAYLGGYTSNLRSTFKAFYLRWGDLYL